MRVYFIIVITVATFLIIPACLLANEGYAISSYNFSLLFSSSEFMSAIVKDYVVSLIFTTLGISGVIANLKKKFQPQNIDQNSTKPQSNIQDANNVPQQNQSENSNQK